MSFSLVKADKDLFAVYHTIYSNADIEMWFDWNKRLSDTKWTEQCFFLTQSGKKVGGAIITDETIQFPFIVPPFSDRVAFWNAVLKLSGRKRINGVLKDDADILPMFDYETVTVNQIMCRPTDIVETSLHCDFSCMPLDINADEKEIGDVIIKSYENGICNRINGIITIDAAIEDAKRVLDIYSYKNVSHVIIERQTGSVVAVCLAGINQQYTHGYAEIADLCVLPKYRGLGLAKHLISQSITDSYGMAPFIKLFVYVGNNAEYLYRQMGFLSGPRFTNMTKQSY